MGLLNADKTVMRFNCGKFSRFWLFMGASLGIIPLHPSALASDPRLSSAQKPTSALVQSIASCFKSNLYYPVDTPPPPIQSNLWEKVEAHLAQKLGPDFDPKQLKMINFPLKKYKYPDGKESNFHLIYEKTLIASGWFQKRQNTMRYDIEVQPNFQKIGINPYLLSALAKEYPEVEIVPSRLSIGNSDNAKIFFRKGLDGYFEPFTPNNLYDLIEEPHLDKLLNPMRAKQVRSAILSAYQVMPAGSARIAAGFDELEKIVVKLNPREVYIVARKSSSTRATSPTRVYISSLAHAWEITADGKVIPADNSRIYDLGLYDQMK